MDIALKTPVAEGDPPKAGGPPGLVPGGAGGLRAISFAKPNRGVPRNREKNHKKGKTPKERARPVEMILMDVDGTLTDGTLMVLPDGEEVKAYNVRDGLGILLAHLAGIRLGIITGKTSKSLEKRAERLRIYDVHQGILDKKKTLLEILKKLQLTPERVAYIGDDLGDLAVMKSVGLAAAVADAHPEIRKSAHYVCRAAGGKGAVREFIEFVLESQGKWGEIKTRAHEIRNSNE